MLRAVTIRRRKVEAFEFSCKCERCAHEWKTIGLEAPTRCPGCKSRGFNKPARWKRPDRTREALQK
jgi:predicted Zn-ribbon and HTH transcriptional regulator